MAEEIAASAPAGNRRALTVGLVLTVSMAAFEALAVATILPETVREIGGLALYGWAFTGFLLANLVGIPLAGEAADRRGPAPPFVVGVLCFAAGLAVAGFAGSMEVLVAGRVLQGLGAAGLSSVAYVAVARAYPATEQPHVMALLASAWVVPGLFGPALAAGIAHAVGWRWVFLGLAPATLAAGALALGGLRGLGPPPTRAPRGAAADTKLRDATLLAAGVALTLLGVRREAAVEALGLGVLGAVAAGYALLRLLPPGTLRARAGLPAAIAVLALVNFSFFAVEAFLPLTLTEIRGAGMGVVASALTAGTLAWTAGSWLQARAAARMPRLRLLRGGLLLLLGGLVAASAFLSPSLPPIAAVLAWAVAGLGIGIAYPVTTLAVLEAAPEGREGDVSATMQIANALAIALGTGIGGDLLARATQGGGGAGFAIGLVNAAAVVACGLAIVGARGVQAPKGATLRNESA